MTYKLFLDDIRNPPNGGTWVVAKDFAQAVDIVHKNGYPQFVSFDHDLGNEIPTGMDFAKWLVERDLDIGDMPEDFAFRVHSSNPPGKANIEGLMNKYITEKLKNRE